MDKVKPTTGMHGFTIAELANILVGDVVLHTCLGVDGKFNLLVYRASQPAVETTGI